MRWFLVVFCILMPVLMLSSASLWIDESQTAYHAMRPSLGAWWDSMEKTNLNDSQMPLYMFSEWISANLLGTKEWQLRAPNVVYAWVGILGMWAVGRRRQLPGLSVLFAVAPFLGFYINEARPYVMIMAASAWMLYGWLRFVDSKGTDEIGLGWFCGAGFILCAAHMLGTFLFGSMSAVLIWIGWTRRWRINVRCGWILTGSTFAFSILGIYYTGTLIRGVGGAKLWTVGLGNLIYSVYEISNISAFGPPRSLLREIFSNGSHAVEIFRVLVPYLPSLVFIAGIYAVITIKACSILKAQGVRQGTGGSLFDFYLAIAVVLACGSLLVAACGVGWPFWGRHLAPVFPLFIFLSGLFARNVLWKKPEAGIPTFIGGGLILLLLLGSINQRFNPAYAKDDYRTAAAIAKNIARSGGKVWWVADGLSARYYGVSFDGQIMEFPRDTPRGFLESAQIPDFIILSKPDIYDSTGVLRAYIQKHNYTAGERLPAFTTWRKAQL